jgi:hypothetical protein
LAAELTDTVTDGTIADWMRLDRRVLEDGLAPLNPEQRARYLEGAARFHKAAKSCPRTP